VVGVVGVVGNRISVAYASSNSPGNPDAAFCANPPLPASGWTAPPLPGECDGGMVVVAVCLKFPNSISSESSIGVIFVMGSVCCVGLRKSPNLSIESDGGRLGVDLRFAILFMTRDTRDSPGPGLDDASLSVSGKKGAACVINDMWMYTYMSLILYFYVFLGNSRTSTNLYTWLKYNVVV